MTSAVIPVWNRRDLLARLFDSMESQGFSEVIVVDNGSSDGAGDLARSRGARVLRSGTNEGFARAVNRGIAECRSEFVAILNSDVELDGGWLECLERAMAPDVWFATGLILNWARADLVDGTFDLVCRGGCSWRAGAGRAAAGYREGHAIAMAPMTAALLRRELFERVGLLDERFESYLEDTDFGLRCAALGLSGRYVPEAVARHRGSASAGRWHGEVVRRIARNQVFLTAKHAAGWSWQATVAQGLWGLVALRHGAFGAWAAGKREGFSRLREFEKQPLDDRVWAEQERELRRLQERDGMDAYWRLYFLLAGG